MSSIAASNAPALPVCLMLLVSLFSHFHYAEADWVQTARLRDPDAKLFDPDGDDGDDLHRFGNAVAIANGTLVVGAPWDEIGGAFRAGSATIFEISDSKRRAVQKLSASDAETDDEFGWVVAMTDDYIAVGAYLEGRGGTGAVYVYAKGAGESWTEQQKLIPSDVSADARFSWSLAIQGSTLIVGAARDDSRRGSAYVYTLLASIWTQSAKLTALDGSAGDNFGSAVAIDANTVVVGARYDNVLGAASGAAYVFQRTGEAVSWTQQAKLTPADGQPNDSFGTTVAIEGDSVWVGSDNNVDGVRAGAVYLFAEEGRTWNQRNKLVPSDAAPGDRFGDSLAFQSGTLVVGAAGHNRGKGAVYTFQYVAGAWTEKAVLRGDTFDQFDWYGSFFYGSYRYGHSVAIHDGVLIAAVYSIRNIGWVYAFTESPFCPSGLLRCTICGFFGIFCRPDGI